MISLSTILLATITSLLFFSPQLAVSQGVVANSGARPVQAVPGNAGRPVFNPGRLGSRPGAAKVGTSPNSGRPSFGAPQPDAGRIGIGNAPANGGNPSGRVSAAAAGYGSGSTTTFDPNDISARQVAVKSVLDFSRSYIDPKTQNMVFASEHSLVIFELDASDPRRPPSSNLLAKEPTMVIEITPFQGDAAQAPQRVQKPWFQFQLPENNLFGAAPQLQAPRALRITESSLVVTPAGNTDPFAGQFRHLGYTRLNNRELQEMASLAFCEEFGFMSASKKGDEPKRLAAQAGQPPGTRFVRAIKKHFVDALYPIKDEDWMVIEEDLGKTETAAKAGAPKRFPYEPVRQMIKYDPATKNWDVEVRQAYHGSKMDLKAGFGDSTLVQINEHLNAIYRGPGSC